MCVITPCDCKHATSTATSLCMYTGSYSNICTYIGHGIKHGPLTFYQYQLCLGAISKQDTQPLLPLQWRIWLVEMLMFIPISILDHGVLCHGTCY